MAQSYVKFISHIVKDSEAAINAANKVYSDLNSFIKYVYRKEDIDCGDDLWGEFSHITENDFDEIKAEISADVFMGAAKPIDDIISVIDTLDNGSYGMMLGDSDYGVTTYKCYGKAEFAEVSEEDVKDYVWGTNGYLTLETQISVSDLAKILDCKEEDACDEAEERGDEIAAKLLPDFFDKLFEENKKYLHEFYRYEKTFSNLADVDEKDGIATIRIYFRCMNQTTGQLVAMKKFFDEGSIKGWTLRQVDADAKDGVYTNLMIDHNDSVAIFTTSLDRFETLRFLKMKI